eukprot:166613_1
MVCHCSSFNGFFLWFTTNSLSFTFISNHGQVFISYNSQLNSSILSRLENALHPILVFCFQMQMTAPTMMNRDGMVHVQVTQIFAGSYPLCLSLVMCAMNATFNTRVVTRNICGQIDFKNVILV